MTDYMTMPAGELFRAYEQAEMGSVEMTAAHDAIEQRGLGDLYDSILRERMDRFVMAIRESKPPRLK